KPSELIASLAVGGESVAEGGLQRLQPGLEVGPPHAEARNISAPLGPQYYAVRSGVDDGAPWGISWSQEAAPAAGSAIGASRVEEVWMNTRLVVVSIAALSVAGLAAP